MSDQTSDRTYTCSYCSEEWKESELDDIAEFCRACGEPSLDQTDHQLHEVNRVANEGMRVAVRWLGEEEVVAASPAFAEFCRYVVAYLELTKDGEEE